MTDHLWGAGAIAAVSTAVLVGGVRQLALRHGVLDHPTERGSHTVVTPRGGGLGVVVVVLALWAWRVSEWPTATVAVALGGTAAVALVGWIDDRRGLSVRTRLAVHLLAAGGLASVASVDATTAWTGAGLFLWWAFWSVSSINLVNFMDGINGLVASQIAVFALSLAFFPDATGSVASVEMIVAGACLGFLPWNFPRARIFLGDVGSGALGFLVPVLALLAMRGQGIDLVRAHLPLLPLFADATWTIVRRWRNGERITAPHRSHLYQRLANGGMGHTAVTAIYAAAAVGGALAAHTGSASWLTAWTVLYALATILVGLLLHRYASRQTSTAS